MFSPKIKRTMDILDDEIESVLYIAREVMGEFVIEGQRLSCLMSDS